MAKSEFSTNLQALRKEKKITQEQLADHLGVSAQAVSKWENGKHPESDLLPAIADFFGVSIDYLYGRGGKEVSFEQTVLDKVLGITEKQHEEKKPGSRLAKFIKDVCWAFQIGPWANNKHYYEAPRSEMSDPKMASVMLNDWLYSYMGLRKDNDFYLCLHENEDFDVFENLFNDDPDRLCAFFRLLGNRDKLMVIAYLHSLRHGEYATASTIAKALGQGVKEVEETLSEIIDNIGYSKYGQNAPFQSVMVVNTDKEEKAYGVEPIYGGLLMGVLLCAKDYFDTPAGFQMMINNRSTRWIDRDKIKGLKRDSKGERGNEKEKRK